MLAGDVDCLDAVQAACVEIHARLLHEPVPDLHDLRFAGIPIPAIGQILIVHDMVAPPH